MHLFVLRNHSVNTPAGESMSGLRLDAVNVDKFTARASRLIASGDKIQPPARHTEREITSDKYQCKIRRREKTESFYGRSFIFATVTPSSLIASSSIDCQPTFRKTIMYSRFTEVKIKNSIYIIFFLIVVIKSTFIILFSFFISKLSFKNCFARLKED